MRLRTRLVLVVAGSVSLGIIAVAAVLTFLAWRSIVTQAEAEGQVIARMLAQSATVSEQVAAEVGTLLDQEMAAHGVLASHLADVADQAGLSDRTLSRRLREITSRSAIDDLWISDARGRPRAGATDEADEPARISVQAGLPDGSIDPLLSGTAFSAPLGVGGQSFGGTPRRYVGVGGIDHPRAVLVGRDQQYLEHLSQTMGVQRLLDSLRHSGTVEALWVFDSSGRTVARSLSPRQEESSPELQTSETDLVQDVLSGQPSRSILPGNWITVAAAMPDSYGMPAGVALVRLSRAPLDGLVFEYVRTGGLMALLALLGGVLLSIVTGRRIAAPMVRIAEAAAAVDAHRFVPGSLAPIAGRRDELGHLARTFEVMAETVFAREEDLERQVRERTLELQIKNEQLDQAKRRLEADLELAKLLQATILPQAFPSDRGWNGTARMTPALQMAGDFYDYFQLDEDRTALVIADVSGKGVAPAFFMAVSRAALQDAAHRHDDDPGACLAAANDRLCGQNPLDMFVTVFYAVIDDRDASVVYANGGHNKPYVIGADGTVRALPLTGDMALGVMPGMDYSTGRLTMKQGDTLFLYTDGVTEAMNPSDEEFGEARLEAVLARAATLPVDGVLETVTTAVREFADSAPQSDDITCLVVRYVEDRFHMAP
ncbi:MAG: SpoIIE family protein phosphatase [Acetobacteraceae bacterium]